MRQALQQAFAELIEERGYEATTVADIVDRADAGRSTFYRHFPSKADVLVGMHEDIFTRFTMGLSTAADWLAAEPTPQLVALLQQYQRFGDMPAPLSSKLGKDLDYIVRNITSLLTGQFEASLRNAFAERDSDVPFDLLAHAVAATYMSLLLAWFTGGRRDHGAERAAGHIQRLTRAMVREAVGG